MDGKRRTPDSSAVEAWEGRSILPGKQRSEMRNIILRDEGISICFFNWSFTSITPIRNHRKTILRVEIRRTVNCEKLSKSLGLDFWIKAVGIFIPTSIFVGYILLNCFYAFWWGFTDDGVSKAICTAVMIWFTITLFQACVLGKILDYVTAKIEESKYRTVIIGLFVALAVAPIASSFAPPVRHFANSHQIHLPATYLLIILVGIFHLCLLLGLTAPVAWLKEINKQRPLLEGILNGPTGTKRSPLLYGCWFLTLAPVLVFVFWVFSGTYMLIPARYGGGGPDPIDLWVPRSAQSILSGLNCKIIPDNQESGKIGVTGPGAEYLHYSNLYLIHEGSGNLVLTADHCNQILQISKEFIKGIQWRNQRFTESSQQQAPPCKTEEKGSPRQKPVVSSPH